jgi:hypothetical protein
MQRQQRFSGTKGIRIEQFMKREAVPGPALERFCRGHGAALFPAMVIDFSSGWSGYRI